MGTTRCPDLPSSVEELGSCQSVVACGQEYFSWGSDDRHGIDRIYDRESLELVAVHEWSDVPSFCDNTLASIWHGQPVQCDAPCVVFSSSNEEDCQLPALLFLPACESET